MVTKTYTIQIIEDEKILADALKRKLEKNGFNVIISLDGKEGYEEALKSKPDLILLDLVLPSMDGITILDSLRKNGWGQNVPIIILTNLSRADIVEKSKGKGANDYLIKTDWKIDEVIKKINYELGII